MTAPGEVVGGRYELIAPLGQGGMAVVWRAKDVRLLREVAIKILDVQEPEDVFYFHREARAAAALTHRNIVQIHDYSGIEERPPYLVMELISGEDAADLVFRLGALPAWVTGYVVQ